MALSLSRILSWIALPPRAMANPAAGAGYRPDIDGLRAVAVLPVVLNHAGIRGFSGGYVGVDIFFVISGYLITGILVRDLAAGEHSIAHFYRRRILRIFPALFAMLLVVTVLAVLAMLPSELRRYGHALWTTAFSGSNILYYSEAGYFDAASRIKPLLHTWSLAIEEQFYVLWPLLLAAIGVGVIARLRAVMLAVTLLSFAVALWMVERDSSAAFFLLPARAWELSLGGLLAITPHLAGRRWLDEALGAAGLAMIGWCVLRYNDHTLFPGAAAAIPCLGAAFLIYSGRGGTFVGRLLSMAPAVFIGRISYSLYLWHWPVIVFSSIWLYLPDARVAPYALWLQFSQVSVAFVLATLSWRYVELPFRDGRRWSNRAVFGAAAAALAAAALAAAILVGSSGFASRLSPQQAAVAAYIDQDEEGSYRRGTCFLIDDARDAVAPECLAVQAAGRPTILLAGDSFAAHLWPGLSRYQDRFALLQATKAGCALILPQGSERPACERYNAALFEGWLAQNRPDVVILAARWVPGRAEPMRATIARLRAHGSRVVIIGAPPYYSASLPRLLVMAERTGDPGLLARSRLNEPSEAEAMRIVAREEGALFISLNQALCPNGACRGWAEPGVPMQFDYGHFTRQGSAVAVDILLPTIEAALRAP